MPDRNRRRQLEEHRDPAEHPLGDHCTQGDDRQRLHPRARVLHPDPHGQRDREHADRAGEQPVAVLVDDAANHRDSGKVNIDQPYVIGQSGTERPEPVLVTSPPAMTRSHVHAATSFANR